MSIDFGMAELQAELTQDEGLRLFPYKDTVGKTTIGVGRNLTDRGISNDEAATLLVSDIALCEAQLDKGLPWWRVLPAPQQRVMLNLCFNMGYAGLSTFHQFLGFMQAKNFAAAASDLAGTAWYGQVGGRGPRMVARLTGTSEAVA